MDKIGKSYSLIFAYKAAVFIVVIILFFLKGGYYYSETIRSITIIFICGVLVLVEEILHSRIKKEFKSFLHTFSQSRSSVMIMLLMGGAVCAYCFSLINAYDFEATLHEIIKYTSLLVFTFIVSKVFQTHYEKKTLLVLIYVIGAISVICALSVISNGHVDQWLNAFASFFLKIPTALVAMVEGEFVEGFMQYANAYASYLGACFYIGLFLIINENRRFVKAIYLCMQVLICLVFILTKSRGGNLIWAGVSVVAIIVTKAHRQRLIYYLALITANVALVYYAANFTTSYAITCTNLWLWLLCSAILIILLTCVCLPKFTNKLDEKTINRRVITRKRMIILLAIVVLACGTLFVIVISRKAKLILDDGSIYSRLLYVRGSFEIFKEHYLTGAGGNAWQYLYANYLNIEGLGLTRTRFPHSYFLKLMTECGITGIIVFGGMVFTQIKLFVKSFRIYKRGEDSTSILLFIASGGLFAHAIIDFDFTYYYILLLWIVLMLFGSSSYSKQIHYSLDL